MIKFSKVRNVKTPEYGTSGSAGIDFYIPDEDMSGLIAAKTGRVEINDKNPYEFLIYPNSGVLISSGIKVSLQENWHLEVKNKSGVAAKSALVKGAELIDSDYQGELFFNLHNVGNKPVTVYPGAKIIQLVHVYYEQAKLVQVSPEDLYSEVTDRGRGGFGSTGV